MRIAALLVLALSACGAGHGAIDIAVVKSRYEPADLRVEAGATVTFTVTNEDPIPHEFIIGTHLEQLAHERGGERTHDGAPGAASLEPGETDRVSFTFRDRGRYEFACHLPGHYAFGMVGSITVT